MLEQNALYNKHPKKQPKKKSAKAVTICIASICENSSGFPKIVFCSDRLVTDSNGLTFELGLPKVVALINNCLVMNAGDAANGDAIIRDLDASIINIEPSKREQITVKDVAYWLKSLYDSQRDKAIENAIFKPRGMDRETFYKNIKNFPDWLALTIDNEVRNYSFDVAFILLGIDINQADKIGFANLYEISGGELQYMTPTGFSMVGIGSYQSLPEITKEPYSPLMPLSDGIVRTFWAKKLSERMVSVGRETTDLGILYAEIDKETKKMVVKNTLLTDDFKSKILCDAFEHQKKVMKQMATEVQNNIEQAFNGTKAIGQPNA